MKITLTSIGGSSVVVLEHEGDEQVAVEAVVGSQGLDVALVLGEKAVKPDLATLLVKVLSHHPSKIENLKSQKWKIACLKTLLESYIVLGQTTEANLIKKCLKCN